MVKFINQLTGTVMYVAEERAAEYPQHLAESRWAVGFL